MDPCKRKFYLQSSLVFTWIQAIPDIHVLFELRVYIEKYSIFLCTYVCILYKENSQNVETTMQLQSLKTCIVLKSCSYTHILQTLLVHTPYYKNLIKPGMYVLDVLNQPSCAWFN